ncbi:hypothetical protein PUN28_017527 [Cardiocondyla obscurior]|uniref:Secreted protein n=1 Tax=Cardiocondyla obscurior TaxID=286306 RepID=A0AAW2EKJ9_9HYME
MFLERWLIMALTCRFTYAVLCSRFRFLKDQNTRTVASIVRYRHRGVINLRRSRCVKIILCRGGGSFGHRFH